jgi:hypothetical protein
MDQEMLSKQYRVLQIIWLAMLASLGVYLGICILVGGDIRSRQTTIMHLGNLRNILLLVAVAEIVLIGFLRKRMLTPVAGMTRQAASQRYILRGILTCAIAESIGIFGMILYFLGDTLEFLYLLTTVSAGTMIYYRPKFLEYREWIGSLKG